MTSRPTHSPEAEQAVLGGILTRPDVMRRLDALEVEDFYNPRHKAVWSAMAGLYAQGKPIDLVLVGDEIVRLGYSGRFNDGMQLAFLGELSLHPHSAESVVLYAEILVKRRTERDLLMRLEEIATAVQSVDNADDPDFEGEGAVQWAMRELGRIKTREGGAELPIGKLVEQRMGQLAKIWADRENGVTTLTGLPTGIADLDTKLGGYQTGILTILAGRPAMGKSAVMRASSEACSKAGIGAHDFSLEDTRDAFTDRSISSESKVPAETIRRAELTREQFEMLKNGVARLRQRQWWLVDDRSGITARDVIRSYRRAMDKNKTRIVKVDYIQRLRRRDQRMSMHEHMTDAAAELADAAKQDGIAIVAGCQLNRAVEQREDKRPMLSDLRESGSTEELAKCVIGCYRGIYYYPEAVAGVDYDPREEPKPHDAEFAALLLLLVLKNSNGRTGQARGVWDGPTISAR